MMHATRRPFDVLFLTNFSESCFKAIPALAQMCDAIEMRLTILHTYQEASRLRELESDLRSFFPEADDYGCCRRVLSPGSPLDGVRRMQAEGHVDLVVAPAGDPLGLPRVGHRSLRSQLMTSDGTPMWTIGNGTPSRRLVRPARSVACCLELGRKGRVHLKLACQYARAMHASLHVIQVMPEIHEGNLLLLATADPFDDACAAADVRRFGGGDAPEPEVHVTDRTRLAELLARRDIDVVFLDANRWIRRSWFAPRIDRLADRLPCAAVYVDAEREDVHWQFTQNPARAYSERLEMPALPPVRARARATAGDSITLATPLS